MVDVKFLFVDSGGTQYDCGESVTPDDSELSCGETSPSYYSNKENKQCLWHFHVSN